MIQELNALQQRTSLLAYAHNLRAELVLEHSEPRIASGQDMAVRAVVVREVEVQADRACVWGCRSSKLCNMNLDVG